MTTALPRRLPWTPDPRAQRWPYLRRVPAQRHAEAREARAREPPWRALDDFFFENQVKPTGDPLLLLEKWNEPNDYITFDFCFPILKNDSLRLTPKTHFISLSRVHRQF